MEAEEDFDLATVIAEEIGALDEGLQDSHENILNFFLLLTINYF
jgi:hypothetical protein